MCNEQGAASNIYSHPHTPRSLLLFDRSSSDRHEVNKETPNVIEAILENNILSLTLLIILHAQDICKGQDDISD